jgi:hypothetical protein
LKSGLASLFVGGAWYFSKDKIPTHNWDGYDFGSPPHITDGLNQGPFIIMVQLLMLLEPMWL